MADAKDYWPSCTDDSSNSNPCNGDGNGTIDYTTTCGTTANEDVRAWQHLGLSEIIPQKFTGVVWFGQYRGGENYPIIDLPEGNEGVVVIAQETWPQSLSQTFQVGKKRCNKADGPGGWHATDAKKFDKKFDDGKAWTGTITSGDAAARWRKCIDANGDWLLTETENVCAVNFWWK